MRLRHSLVALGLFTLPLTCHASGFQIWEQDGASIGEYHAGYAAKATDASIAFYNPGGITLIQHPQWVLGSAEIISHLKYTGTIAVNTYNGNTPQDVTAQGGTSNFVPSLHYVAPLSDKLGFGFSIDVPFGLSTHFGADTFMRYASVKTSAEVVDVSPSLAWQISDRFSFGAGVDLQRMSAEFVQVGVAGVNTDTTSTNQANDTGYGFHLGGLYQFSPYTRVGLSYHSQVVHHLTGTSKFVGPLADALNGGPIVSERAKTDITLPPYTALSVYHEVNPKLAIMGSAIYTQWGVFKDLHLQDVAGLIDVFPSNSLSVVIPQYFHNTWNFSVGSNYRLTDRITLRAGIGYDQSPTNNTYRNILLPDNDRYVVAIGTHFQASRALGFDLGWSHLFIRNGHIVPPPEDVNIGDEVVTMNGSVRSSADVFGLQITWDMV